MSAYESIQLEKSGLIEAGVPPNFTNIAREEVLQADSHSSPPSLKEASLSKRPVNLNKKENFWIFSKGEKKTKQKKPKTGRKKVPRKHTENLATLGYFPGFFF